LINNKNISKIAILVTSVRGGSKLFHYSLDNHPQILSLPRTFQFKPFWNTLNLEKDDIVKICDKFIVGYPRFFDGKIWSKFSPINDKANKLSEKFNESFTVDKKKFKLFLIQLFKKEKNITSKNLFINMHIAFHKAQDKDIINNSIILYHVHGLNHSKDIELCLEDYGEKNIKLIFATRDPIQGLNSVNKWMKDLLFPVFLQPRTLFQYQKVVYFELSNIIKNNSSLDKVTVLLDHQINYQNLLMEKLCKFLDIHWNESLLTPTIQGKLWWGNAIKPKKGINKGTFSKFEPNGVIEKKDWKILCFLFPKRFNLYGYNIKKNISGFSCLILLLLPTKNELEILIGGYKNILNTEKKINTYLIKKKLGDISPLLLRLNSLLLFFYWIPQYFKRIILSLIVFYKRKKIDSIHSDLLINY
jgi:hypothetical protein